VVRAAEFLGFVRAFIALPDGDSYRMRWSVRDGQVRSIDFVFPEGVVVEALSKREVFWSDDLAQVPGVDMTSSAHLEVKQILAVPLVGSDNSVLGVFGVLDRRDGSGIKTDDLDRAKALAAQIAVALEATHHLNISEQHRGRAEDLMTLAVELGSLLRVPEFSRTFTTRAADMLGARAAALALMQGTQLEVMLLHDPRLKDDASLPRRLAIALSDTLAQHPHEIVTGPTDRLLNPSIASALGWKDLTLARLHVVGSETAGILCLADRGKMLDAQDHHLVHALVSQASVALENARLFTKMEQANRHWIEIFDAITDFIVVHDEHHNVLRVNRSLADFIGVSPAELIGVSMRTLLALTNETPAGFCPFCRAGTSDEYVDPVLQRTYLVSTSRIHSPESEGLQTIHVLKDISDRREAERRYRELFDNIQEGLYFSSADGRFIEVNDALVRMLGYENRDELLQIDIPNQLYLTPGHRTRFRENIEDAGVLRNYQEALRKKDGSLIHTLQNVFAVRDAKGNVIQYRGVMLDISELKTFQSQLQHERDFNTKILNNTQSMILVTDRSGAITYANRRCHGATGYNQEQIVGRALSDLIAPARRDSINSALRSTVSGQQVDNLELPLLRSDGRLSQFSINMSPMRDEQGQVTSIVVVMTDITDAAMLQAKLMHTEKMAAVGHLVSGVAHEVNNPLTAILGFADLLMDNPQVPESAKADLRVILQEAQRTKQIVQNLLSFARQMPPQRKPVQLNSVLRRTLQLRSYDFASHGVEIEELLDDKLPEVIGDSHQVQQVFLNILNNAYDAVRETGRPARITLETRLFDGYAEVAFRDNGNGIKHAERIFDPFFTTKGVGEGTGLGLSICYGIVREHGGEIACYNNPDGVGATFIVRLPLSNEAAPTRPAGVLHEQRRNEDS
jgi:PAS domain S-box-containing protein